MSFPGRNGDFPRLCLSTDGSQFQHLPSPVMFDYFCKSMGSSRPKMGHGNMFRRQLWRPAMRSKSNLGTKKFHTSRMDKNTCTHIVEIPEHQNMFKITRKKNNRNYTVAIHKLLQGNFLLYIEYSMEIT